MNTFTITGLLETIETKKTQSGKTLTKIGVRIASGAGKYRKEGVLTFALWCSCPAERGEPVFLTGELEPREYNGKTFTDFKVAEIHAFASDRVRQAHPEPETQFHPAETPQGHPDEPEGCLRPRNKAPGEELAKDDIPF